MDELLTSVISNAPAVGALLFITWRQQKALEKCQDLLREVLMIVLNDEQHELLTLRRPDLFTTRKKE